jgi:hypothetical protein
MKHKDKFDPVEARSEDKQLGLLVANGKRLLL